MMHPAERTSWLSLFYAVFVTIYLLMPLSCMSWRGQALESLDKSLNQQKRQVLSTARKNRAQTHPYYLFFSALVDHFPVTAADSDTWVLD